MSGWQNLVDAANRGWQNLVDNDGLTIAVSGMVVVFAALAIISGFIWLLPRALELLAKVAPEREETHLSPKPAVAASSEDASIAAAIGFAMYLDKQEAKAN
jgi:Na+-transporting methylmalonyl-CoA/oxaloacetate decarboxylase gamma subunit